MGRHFWVTGPKFEIDQNWVSCRVIQKFTEKTINLIFKAFTILRTNIIKRLFNLKDIF
jgi:hypothetical protein